MRVLVLGGTGAMGKLLVKLLGKRGDEVYVTSRKKRESNGNIRFIQGDAHDLFFMHQELSKNYDAIVDFVIYSTEDFKKRLRIYLNKDLSKINWTVCDSMCFLAPQGCLRIAKSLLQKTLHGFWMFARMLIILRQVSMLLQKRGLKTCCLIPI